MKLASGFLYLGLPQWQHPHWRARYFESASNTTSALKLYSRLFNSVEGNTTFYALPNRKILTQWNESTPDSFRFCFKFPQTISHRQKLRFIHEELNQFYQVLAPLGAKAAILWLQLPPAFSPNDLNLLEQFLNTLSTQYHYGIEVRHADFFDKADNEKRFFELLRQYHFDRVMMDTRALFNSKLSTPAVMDAQRKKPKLPLHVSATGDRPLVRFIGDADLQANQDYLKQWVDTIATWLRLGKHPSMFIHTADNADAPKLARNFYELLVLSYPELQPQIDWESNFRPVQAELF